MADEKDKLLPSGGAGSGSGSGTPPAAGAYGAPGSAPPPPGAPPNSPAVLPLGGPPVTGVMPEHLSLLTPHAPGEYEARALGGTGGGAPGGGGALGAGGGTGGGRRSLVALSELADSRGLGPELGFGGDYDSSRGGWSGGGGSGSGPRGGSAGHLGVSLPAGGGAGAGGGGMPKKSYSVSADGSVSYLTPVEMGRHELYEAVPFAAVFGMGKKERNLSRAFASYAADLDALEADQEAWARKHEHLPESEMEQRRSTANLLLLEELDADASTVTTPLIFAVIVASMSQFLVGYNTGVMNAPSAVVFPGHSTASWSMAVAAFAVGGPFGAVVAGNLADTRGRRGALLINTYLFLLGGLVQTFAMDMVTIIVSRFLIGIASGSSSVLVPIYLGELAPPTLRGTLGTMTQFALVIGILVSNLLGFPFATVSRWRVLFAVTPLCSVLQLLLSPFLLESPRWLLGRDPNSRKARFIIKKVRGLRYDHEVETEANHFLSAAQVQKPCEESENFESKSAVREMFADTKIRLLVVSAIVLQVSQQLCGINAVFYYSNMFFDGVIENPLVGTTIVGAVNVAATYVALLLMDSCGRRTLIMWSSGVMFISCIVIVLSLLGYFGNMVALLFVNVYVIFFEIGMGPIPWLIVAEMFDAKYVATAMSVSCQVNWFCNFIIGLVFPYMNKYLGPYSFGPFAVVLLGVFLFAWIWLPETQGTTPEELQAALIKKNASVVYHNLNVEANHNPVDVEWRLAMDQIKREEEEQMRGGTYDYGFAPISRSGGGGSSAGLRGSQAFEPPSDWQSSMMGAGTGK